MNTSHASESLRDVLGLDNQPPKLSDSVPIMVDFQNTYRTGVMELEGAEAAVAAGVRLLERARAEGAQVVHIMNDGGEGTPYDIRAEIGAISDEVAPTVVADTTAIRALTAPDGTILPATAPQEAALTGITDLFGTVVPTADALPS